jgi:hypothetical protein
VSGWHCRGRFEYDAREYAGTKNGSIMPRLNKPASSAASQSKKAARGATAVKTPRTREADSGDLLDLAAMPSERVCDMRG